MKKIVILLVVPFLFLSCSKEEQKQLYATALAHYEQKQFTSTMIILKKLISQDRNNKKYLFLLGKCFYSTGNKKKALVCLKKAYQNNRSLQDINIFYARLLLEQGDKQKGLTVLLKAWEFDRNNLAINNMLSGYYLKQNEYEKALFYLKILEYTEQLLIESYSNQIAVTSEMRDTRSTLKKVQKIYALAKEGEQKERIKTLIQKMSK